MSKQILLLTGASGQLGKTFQSLWLESSLDEKFELHAASRQELDVTSSESVSAIFSAIRPAVVVNCSAYTAVDKAESDKEKAYQVNEAGPRNLALHCKKSGARLLHVSTDFVFSGNANTPLKTAQETSPLGVYGASKRAGELVIQNELTDDHIIVRTSWLYSPFNTNFVKTMLRLMAEKESLGVVADQMGSPTSTFSLCAALFKVIESPSLSGTYHWSDAGEISWYDFALAIQKSALEQGILDKKIPVNPIATSDYPTPAKRPSYSVLDCSSFEEDFNLPQFNWRPQLDDVVQKIKVLNEQEKLGE